MANLSVPESTAPGEVAVVGQCQTAASGTDGIAETTLTVVAAGEAAPAPTAGGGGGSNMDTLPLTGPRDVVPEDVVGLTLLALGMVMTVAARPAPAVRRARWVQLRAVPVEVVSRPD